uniref:Dipeptidyl peptidase 3 n=1 Tax=Philasterides dicentrarchi TaxID=282688 RepID=A0A481SBC1_9CILI|nr:peptidase family M49 containing protein [Philasterides dicentrarchi]
MKREEIDNVDEFLKIVNIDPLNTRIIKINDDHFQVLLASVNMNTQTHFHNKKRIDIVRGDFSPFLRRVTQNLQEALNYTANSYQEQMIKYYIEHFQSGDIEMHKNSQRSWIRDKGPIVETNIGFIESYLDPKQVRAEWEGFSAIVNKNESEKTHNFVKNAEKCLKMMPWPQEFEKDQFLKPDFTSLDVIQNGASMTFAGINIPNYDDIRQNEGFKNVYLKNCIHSRKKADQNFCLIDQEIMKTYGDQVVFHQVIYHELLGHGCGKLFYLKDEQTQSYNFDIENTVNPLNGQKITTFYKEQDTWMSVFQNLSNPYEECRADCVALYFSCFEESFSFLQPEFLSEWQNINKACFLDLISQGINGLQFYDVNEKKWGQAHINGRWVILQVLLEIGEDFLQIQKCLKEHDEEGIEIKLNKDLILTKGKEALSQFLLKMQVYKSTADYQSASKMFNKYSEVSEKFLQIRDIVIKNKKPRRVELQGHLSLDSNKKVVYTCFQESFEGIIESYMARYPYFDLEMYNLFMFYREYNRN